jgi:hypothetical protein
MASKRPWYPQYPKDIATDLKYRALPRPAKLTYRELLDLLWLEGCRLPDDPEMLAASLHMEPEAFLADWERIQRPGYECFIPHPDQKGCLTNKRMLQEWRKASQIADTARENGRKGGRPKGAAVGAASGAAKEEAKEEADPAETRAVINKNPEQTRPKAIHSQSQNHKEKHKSPEPAPAQAPPEEELSRLRQRYHSSPGGREIMERTFAALASTRKSGKVAPSVLAGFLGWARGHSAESVLKGCRTYLDKGYAAEGKGEAYLKGIIRNLRPDQSRAGPCGPGNSVFEQMRQKLRAVEPGGAGG